MWAERVLGIGGLVLCAAFVPFVGSTQPSSRAAVSEAPGQRSAAPIGLAAKGLAVRSDSARAVAGCRDAGSDGKRIEALYVYGDRQRSRFPSLEKTFRTWLERIDQAFVQAAKRTDDVRHPRFIRDRQCRTVVRQVMIDQDVLEDEEAVAAQLKMQGYRRTDRKYIVWYDAPGCGLGFGDGGNDRPEWYNLYNFGPHYAMIGTSCWGWSATMHELLHNLGAVQSSAPHASKNGHCWDDEDVMCYDDQGLPKSGLKVLCKKYTKDDVHRIDCNGDDYFNTRPPPGSYLDSHWNVADSLFLSRQ